MHLSPASILAGLVAFMLMLFILTLSLVAYSPVLGIPARIPHRGRPFARKPRAEHHPARLDGAHDERHADLQREHSPDHGGHARPWYATSAGLDGTRRASSKALVMPSREDSLLRAQMEGDRPLRTIAGQGGSSAQDAARGHRAMADARRGHHHRKSSTSGQGHVRHPDRRGRRRPQVIGRRQRHGRVRASGAPETGYIVVPVQHAGNLTLGLQEPRAVASSRPARRIRSRRAARLQRRPAGRGHRLEALRLRTLERRQARRPRGVHRLLMEHSAGKAPRMKQRTRPARFDRLDRRPDARHRPRELRTASKSPRPHRAPQLGGAGPSGPRNSTPDSVVIADRLEIRRSCATHALAEPPRQGLRRSADADPRR